MKDVILISPPISFFLKELAGDERMCAPLGILYIAGSLEREGFSVQVIDVKSLELTIEQIIEILRDEKPRVVGISALTSGTRSTVILAKRIKDEFGSNISIVLGGAHVSADPEFIQRFPYFDFAILGEGEITLPKLVKEILSGREVKGIYPGEPVLDLDSIPFPARHLVRKDPYSHAGKYICYLTATRGCPYKCTFCSRPGISKKIRFRSPKSVVDEMELMYDDCKGHFGFICDTFSINMENAYNIAQEIIDRKLKCKWDFNTRADLLNEELVKKAAEAGCYQILLGVESGSERIRNKVIEKNVLDRDIFQAVSLCRKYKIQATLYLMMGFPGETWEDLKKTASFPLRAKADLMGCHLTIVLPGAKIYEMALQERQVPIDFVDQYVRGERGEGFKENWPVYVPSGLTLNDLRNARKRAYRQFYFRPGFLLKRFSKISHMKQLWWELNAAFHLFFKGKTKTSYS